MVIFMLNNKKQMTERILDHWGNKQFCEIDQVNLKIYIY